MDNLYVSNKGKLYKAVPCGRACSFAKEDGTDDFAYGFNHTHCTKKCYLPKWWSFLETSAKKSKRFIGLKRISKKDIV